ncbi:MAG: imidazole glycerol phosphate synthase subunit HisH [Planctomycetota bacterium]
MDIAIINYGIGNLRSVEKAFQFLGFDAHLTENPQDIADAGKLVLPGVGNFGECVTNLLSRGLVEPLLKAVKAGKPLLGICVGLQMLFEDSEEAPTVKGLGLLKGSVRRFRGNVFEGPQALKVPQIGWNELKFPVKIHPLFAGTMSDSYVYFVHSYAVYPTDESNALAWSDYGGQFCAAAGQGHVIGTQFHPEKSQAVGLRLLNNFGKMSF